MTQSKPLLFVSQLKEYLSEDPNAVTTTDWVYSDSINATTALFEKLVKHSFTSQEYIEYHNSYLKDNLTVYLNSFPVNTVSPFKVFLWQDNADFTVELDNTQYDIDFEKGIVRINKRVHGKVKVEYTAGYAYSTYTGVIDDPLDETLERALGLHIPSALKVAALKQASQFVSAINPSPCNTSTKNVLSTPKTNYSLFGINPSSAVLLSSFTRPKMTVV